MTFANKFVLVLNETINKKRKEVGKVNVPYPTLHQDFKLPAALAKDENGQDKWEDGIPVYENAAYDWLQQAIVSAVSMKARNRFVPKTATLKPGVSLAEDFESLTAETARTGEALIMRRDARTSFENYLRGLKKSEPFITRFGELFWNSTKVFSSLSEDYRKAMKTYVAKWVESLDSAQATRFLPKINELQESITASEATSDADLLAEAAQDA